MVFSRTKRSSDECEFQSGYSGALRIGGQEVRGRCNSLGNITTQEVKMANLRNVQEVGLDRCR